MTKQELHKLKIMLDDISHCGDYGQFYLSKNHKECFMVFGDADEPNISELEKAFPQIKFHIEGECGPEDENKWVLISYGKENVNKWCEKTKDFVHDYYYNRFLSLEEYADFLKLYNKAR